MTLRERATAEMVARCEDWRERQLAQHITNLRYGGDAPKAPTRWPIVRAHDVRRCLAKLARWKALRVV